MATLCSGFIREESCALLGRHLPPPKAFRVPRERRRHLTWNHLIFLGRAKKSLALIDVRGKFAIEVECHFDGAHLP